MSTVEKFMNSTIFHCITWRKINKKIIVCVCVQFICGSAKLNKNTSKSLLNSQIKIMLRYLGDVKEMKKKFIYYFVAHLIYSGFYFYIHSFQFLLHTKKILYYKTFSFIYMTIHYIKFWMDARMEWSDVNGKKKKYWEVKVSIQVYVE